MSASHRHRTVAALAIGLALAVAFAGGAEARRGGSFGSRGMRTYQAPRSTYTSPYSTAPIQRSMTPPGYAPGYGPASRPAPAPYAPRAIQPRGGFLSRWGGPILGGLFAAGLFGLLMGHGIGGAGFGFGAGLLALVVQVALIALVVGLVSRLFRRGQPAYGGPAYRDLPYGSGAPEPPLQRPMTTPAAAAAAHGDRSGDEIGLTQADFDAFERLLQEVQAAFSREDYAGLREHTTPEVMSYLAEELAQNAAAGRRNEVRDVRLVQGDLAEAWTEGERDYATVAMRYESVDLMRDRNDGHVLEGEDRPTETTETWTFVRDRAGGGPWGGGGATAWKLAAIQT